MNKCIDTAYILNCDTCTCQPHAFCLMILYQVPYAHFLTSLMDWYVLQLSWFWWKILFHLKIIQILSRKMWITVWRPIICYLNARIFFMESQVIKICDLIWSKLATQRNKDYVIAGKNCSTPSIFCRLSSSFVNETMLTLERWDI